MVQSLQTLPIHLPPLQNEPLLVETPGVLDNDSYNGEPAEDGGATAELLAGPLFGALACEFDAGLELCANGSFSHTPGVDFPGSDTFTYRTGMPPVQRSNATLTFRRDTVSSKMALRGDQHPGLRVMVTHEPAEFSSTDADGLISRRDTVQNSGRFETV